MAAKIQQIMRTNTKGVQMNLGILCKRSHRMKEPAGSNWTNGLATSIGIAKTRTGKLFKQGKAPTQLLMEVPLHIAVQKLNCLNL
jgi:hypothetical protein